MGSLSDNAQGAIFMMVSMAGFVINDTLMKLAAAEASLFQVMLLRGLVATGLLGLLAWRRGALWPRLDRAGRRLIGLRVCGEIGATTCYLTALFHMPIANATAILQSLPLAVTLGAALVLGETVGRRRYIAIAIGFAGVLGIVQPGSEGFTGYSLWALGAVGFMVVRDLTTRRLGREIPSIFVALTTAVGITIVGGLVCAFRPWQPVPGPTLVLLGAAAFFLVVGYLFNVMTMRKGEIGFVSPFRYTILIWAIVLGIVVFGEVPNPMAFAGAAVVVMTGVYTFYRERMAARRALRLPATSGAPGRSGA